MKNYRVPRGHVLVRPDAARTMHEGLFLAVEAQEAPPSGVVVLESDEVSGYGYEQVEANEGDRVHYKRYSGVVMTLTLPSSPHVERCAYCNSRMDDHELLPMCPKRGNVLSGAPEPHEFGLGKQEPEDLLVLDLRDVILVEVGEPDDIGPDMPFSMGELYAGVME